MKKNFKPKFSSIDTDSIFHGLSKIAVSMTKQKTVEIMHYALSHVPLRLSRNPTHIAKILKAVEHYLNSGDLKRLDELNHEQTPLRLAVCRTFEDENADIAMSAIFKDAAEFLALLPESMTNENYNRRWYLVNLSNILWLVRETKTAPTLAAEIHAMLRMPTSKKCSVG